MPKSNETRKEKKRTSKYDPDRRCYMSDDGMTYYYVRTDSETGKDVRISLPAGKDGVTQELILLLDEMDHDEDLGNRYEREHRDKLFDDRRDRYEADPDDDKAVDPWDTVSRTGDDPADILFRDEEKENPNCPRVRKVIKTCSKRQQNVYYAHFGEGRQLEEVRKEEVAASGKEKTLQAVENVKNDLIRKVADEFGVTPKKRRRTKKG